MSTANIPQQHNFALEYTPSDFFYLTNKKDVPTSDTCTNLLNSPPDCSSATDPTILKQCYDTELCRNKVLAEQMYNKRGKHSNADAKLTDFQQKYRFEVITTINLGIGIIGTIAYIYYNRE